jgi:YesN/AraC family two-component response regulator
MLYIKYMVTLRCRMTVKSELKDLNLQYVVVDIGTVEILEEVNHKQLLQLKEKLLVQGMELLNTQQSALIENIIKIIIEMINSLDASPVENYHTYISRKAGVEYSDLSTLFNEVKCVTIQQFINTNKVEKVKEFLLYDQYTFKEIATKLNYHNVAELKAEFKKNTGLSLTYFKRMKAKRAVKPLKN